MGTRTITVRAIALRTGGVGTIRLRADALRTIPLRRWFAFGLRRWFHLRTLGLWRGSLLRAWFLLSLLCVSHPNLCLVR